jgi:hypothetical protein
MDPMKKISDIERFLGSVPGDYTSNCPSDIKRHTLSAIGHMLDVMRTQSGLAIDIWRQRLEELRDRLAKTDPFTDARTVDSIRDELDSCVYSDAQLRKIERLARESENVSIINGRLRYFEELSRDRELTDTELEQLSGTQSLLKEAQDKFKKSLESSG